MEDVSDLVLTRGIFHVAGKAKPGKLPAATGLQNLVNFMFRIWAMRLPLFHSAPGSRGSLCFKKYTVKFSVR